MGRINLTDYSGKVVQLILQGRRAEALVRSNEDWHALRLIAERMRFWCGGAIIAYRCHGNEMRFALRVHRAPLGAMAHHLSGAYAIRMRHRRGWKGAVFKHYRAIALEDELFLDDLIAWFDRPLDDGGRKPTRLFTRTVQPSKRVAPSKLWIDRRPSFETIVRFIAAYCGVDFDDMRSASRKRTVSRAKIIATVLATRNGATVALAARFFNRSRSTLVEQAEHYRATQPGIFIEAEAALEEFIANGAR